MKPDEHPDHLAVFYCILDVLSDDQYTLEIKTIKWTKKTNPTFLADNGDL